MPVPRNLSETLRGSEIDSRKSLLARMTQQTQVLNSKFVLLDVTTTRLHRVIHLSSKHFETYVKPQRSERRYSPLTRGRARSNPARNGTGTRAVDPAVTRPICAASCPPAIHLSVAKASRLSAIVVGDLDKVGKTYVARNLSTRSGGVSGGSDVNFFKS